MSVDLWVPLISLLALSLVTAPLSRRLGSASGIVLATLTAAAGCLLLWDWRPDPAAAPAFERPWMPSLGVDLALRVDGLAATFVALVAGIGALVLLYADSYLQGSAVRERVLALLVAFVAAMLGIVVADDLVTLFVFWELTSITSYLLIGTRHEDPASRRSARQAMLVTGAGGIALLVGLLLLARIGQDLGLDPSSAWRVSALASLDPRDHGLYPAATLLILLGVFTKSAQFPFHFWLPAAMAAPTPVSALLHSATMVKAGVFLLARLHPTLSGTALFSVTVTTVGMVTMLYAALVALRQRDLKKILAWSTVSVLGTLTMLLGVGTVKAIEAAIVFLVAHALYKATLFLVAGNVEHGTGTRDTKILGGLWRVMPWTAFAGIMAALSKAGAPPMFGFVGKELVYKAKLSLEEAGAWLIVVAVLANVALVGAAFLAGVRPFLGSRHELPRAPREATWPMGVGPFLLAILGIFIGIVPDLFDRLFGEPMARAITGDPAVTMRLKLWHGVDPLALSVLGFSALTLGVGIVAFRAARRLHAGDGPMVDKELFAGRAFERGLEGLYAAAGWWTRRLHPGRLRRYLLVTVLVSTVLLLAALFAHGPPPLAPVGLGPEWIDLALVALTAGGALFSVTTGSRLAAVAGLGATGVGMSLLFVQYSAPDLAITQIMVETLTVILFVLVFYRLRPFTRRSAPGVRARDGLVAAAMGTTLALVLLAVSVPAPERTVSAWQAARSVAEANGRNVVNVILVDFRALDTLGEVVVVVCAGLGVLALSRTGRRRTGAGARDG